ncbi:MAG: efflux RND transporter periplasmic adaptor subunit [Gemmatimonadetes bacterium]|nr:efflux RND transporter periplasmic adaptor subunit [Gemmatimonadota bacterium]
MTGRTKLYIVAGVVLVAGAAAGIPTLVRRQRGTEVRMEEVTKRDLVATVTASGRIRARRAVDIRSDVMGRVMELNVREGDPVRDGQVLLRIDQTQIAAEVARMRAAVSQARAQEAQQRSTMLQAQRAYQRASDLHATDSTLISAQQFEDAETAYEAARALWEAATQGIAQAEAGLAEATSRLEKTTIRAPISGTVTRVDVEAGETAIIGTMNNPGSLLLTISDLSVIEAVVEVDETDVPEIALGDSAIIEIDALPDRSFTGHVTEIGKSAILPREFFTERGQTPSVDFEVVITLDTPTDELRPDLSCTSDVITDTRRNVLAVPIIALTVKETEGTVLDTAWINTVGAPTSVLQRLRNRAVEGVYVVRGRKAFFQPVSVGIAGNEYFEVLSGLQPGDTVVSGPYQTIRELRDSSAVRLLEEEERRR